MGEETLNELLEHIENVNGAMSEFVDSVRESVKATDGVTSSSERQSKSSVKNADGFDSLNLAVNDTTEEQKEYSKVVTASKAVWGSMTGAVSTAADTLMGMTNDLTSGEGFGMFRRMIEPIGDLMESMGAVLGDVIGGFFKLGGDLPGFGGILEGVGGMADGAGEALGKVASAAFKFISTLALDTTEQLFKMFESVTSSGLLVADGLSEMLSNARELNLSTEEYTNLVKGQAANMTLFGSSVSAGAKRLKEVAKHSEQFSVELRNMGITFEEQAEHQSELMAEWARTGQLRSMTDEQIANVTVNYMKNMQVITALTGKTAESMKKERDERLLNGAMQTELSKLSVEQRAEMDSVLDFLGDEFKQASGEVLLFGNVMTDQGTIATGMNVHIEKMVNAVKSGSSNFDEALQTFRNDMQDAGPALRDTIDSLAPAAQAEYLKVGNTVTASVDSAIAGTRRILAQVENGTKQDVANKKNAGKEQAESTNELMEAMKQQRELMHVILKEAHDRLPEITSVLKATTQGVSDLFDKIKKESGEGGMIDNAKDVFGEAVTTIKTMAEGVMNTVTTAMEAGEAAFTSMSKMLGEIGESAIYKSLFGTDEAPDANEGGGMGFGTGKQANMTLSEKLHASQSLTSSNFGPAEPVAPRPQYMIDAEMEIFRERLRRSIAGQEKGVESGKREAQVIEGEKVNYTELLEALKEMNTETLKELQKQTIEAKKGRSATEWVARTVESTQ